MKLFKFARSNSSQIALVADKSGSSLPKSGLPWEYIGTVDINPEDKGRSPAPAAEILEAIERDGIFLIPVG